MPSEHPYRDSVQISWEAKEYYSPPLCGRILAVINLPADALSRRTLYVIARPPFIWTLSSLTWGFTLPVTDPEAFEPRLIYYWVQPTDILFFVLVILLWYWVGSRIDEPNKRGKAELIAVAIIGVLLLTECAALLWGERVSPHHRQVGMFGLIWPISLFLYIWWSVKQRPQAGTVEKSCGG